MHLHLPVGLAIDLPDAAGYWTQQVVRAMGSDAHIVVGDAPAGSLDWAIAELERLEQCWSRFRIDSELSRLNRRGGVWTDVSAPMLLALTCAADLHRDTEGRFDPTVLDALEGLGYDRSFEHVAAVDPTEPRPTEVCGFDGVEIDEDGGRVRLPRGARIDLGGIGKGLAADLVTRGLLDRGARSALIGMSGDLRARGEPPAGGAWEIPVLDPFDDTRVAFRHSLTEGAIVTSTTRVRRWTRGGTEFHHLVDPSTGDSARRGVAAVVVAAPDAWRAEGIAKSIVIAGAGPGAVIAHETGVPAWIFLDDGRVLDIRARK